MFFDISDLPTNPILIVAWPAGLTFLAAIIWYFGYRVEENDGKAPWKWAAAVLLAIALAIGISALKMVFSGDFGLVSDSFGRKIRYAFYGAGAIPIIGLIGFIGLGVFQRLNRAQRF